jgi:hypothetical protein
MRDPSLCMYYNHVCPPGIMYEIQLRTAGAKGVAWVRRLLDA